MFYLPENADEIDLGVYDYVVDCIDTVAAKIDIIRRCHELGVPVLSSMGAANKMDPTAFRVIDISKTHTDPLAKAMRAKLRQMGIHHVKVVYLSNVNGGWTTARNKGEVLVRRAGTEKWRNIDIR